jgi:hypothetical protein
MEVKENRLHVFLFQKHSRPSLSVILQEFWDIKLLADLRANVISSYSIEFVVDLIDTFLTVGTGFVEKVNMIILVLIIKEDVVAS